MKILLLPLLAVLAVTACSTPGKPEPVVVTRVYAQPLVTDPRPPLPYLDNPQAWRGQPVDVTAAAFLADVLVLEAWATYLDKAIKAHNAALVNPPPQTK